MEGGVLLRLSRGCHGVCNVEMGVMWRSLLCVRGCPEEVSSRGCHVVGVSLGLSCGLGVMEKKCHGGAMWKGQVSCLLRFHLGAIMGVSCGGVVMGGVIWRGSYVQNMSYYFYYCIVQYLKHLLLYFSY